jgi:hypothetical protein
MREVVDFFRRNPQALVLLMICLILGVGAFIAVLISIGTSGKTTGPGYPNGAVTLFRSLTAALPLR